MAASSAGSGGTNMFLGVGQNFVFSTIRIGWGGWEGGSLSRGFLGMNKVFPIAGSSLYSSFGLGVNSDRNPVGLGFQAGAGFNYGLFWGLGVRGEMYALANLNGAFSSTGLLGLSYAF